jgi:hypothetical protein
MTDDEQSDAIGSFRGGLGAMKPDQRRAGPHCDAGHEVLRAAGTIAL